MKGLMNAVYAKVDQYIDINIFICSFVIGIIFVYILGPSRKKIVVFPTLSNYTKTLYRDNADQCFKFNMTPVACTNNTSTIPIQSQSDGN
jgi:hypothetical protein